MSSELIRDGHPVPDDVDLFNGGITQAWFDTMAWIRLVGRLIQYRLVYFDPVKRRYWTEAGEAIEVDQDEVFLGAGMHGETLRRKGIIQEACAI